MALTLIKSGIEPNPDTDNEEHFFTYSLYPHAGTWKESDTVKEAEMLNQPVLTTLGAAVEPMSFVSSDDDNVIIETVKASEDGKGRGSARVRKPEQAHQRLPDAGTRTEAGFIAAT